MVHVGMAHFRQGDGKGIGGRDDHRLDRRMDHPLGEDRPLLGGAGLGIVILDRGD